MERPRANAGTPIAPNLIEAAIRGGGVEVDELIRAVWPRAYRIALSVVRNHSLAEDAAQEACAILFRSVRRLRSVDAFGVWYYRIVVREALRVERRETQANANPGCIRRMDLDEALIRVDVQNALAALTPAQRIAIALHFYAEMSSREVAEVLGIQDSSVRFHVMRAKRILLKSLGDDGSATTDEAPLVWRDREDRLRQALDVNVPALPLAAIHRRAAAATRQRVQRLVLGALTVVVLVMTIGGARAGAGSPSQRFPLVDPRIPMPLASATPHDPPQNPNAAAAGMAAPAPTPAPDPMIS